MTDQDFPLLRASVAQQYSGLPVADLTRVVQSVYGENVYPEDVEGLFQDIGRGLSRGASGIAQFASQAAPALQKALPSVASGAMTGATVGGPWGALIGAGAGLAGGLLSQSSNKTARGIGGAIGTAGNLISTVRGGGAGGALGSLASVGTGALGNSPGGRNTAAVLRGVGSVPQTGGSANALMGLLARPELAQALSSGMLGQFGRQNINVGGQQVPVHQILAALGILSQRAAHEAAEFDEGAERTPEYAEAAAETLGIDADDAEGRTDTLLTLLALAPSIWMQRPPVSVSVVNPADPYFPTGEGTEDAGESAWAMLSHAESDFEHDEWAEWDEDWGGEDIGAWEHGAPMDWLPDEYDEAAELDNA